MNQVNEALPYNNPHSHPQASSARLHRRAFYPNLTPQRCESYPFAMPAALNVSPQRAELTTS